MADAAVSALPTATTLTGAELLYTVQNGVDAKLSVEALADHVRGPSAAVIELVGDYDNAATYQLYNAVLYNGSTWVYIATSSASGNAPPTLPTTENSYWRLLARAGNNGTAQTLDTLADLGATDLTGKTEVVIARYDASSILTYMAFKAVASAPSHILKGQSADGQWFEFAEHVVTPAHCGATFSTYNDDNSVAVQRAFDVAKTSYDATSGQFKIKCSLAGRMWKVGTSINCTNIRQAGLTIIDGGLYGTCTARAILDLSGTQGVRTNVQFYGDETNQPLCAILLCRAEFPASSGAFGGAGLHDLEEVEITGWYQGAALINYGAEVVKYPRRRVWNNLKSTGRATMIITGDSAQLVKWMGAGAGAGGSRVVSDYATLPSGPVSCINHLFTTFDIRRVSSWGALSISAISKASPGVVTLASATTKISDGDATFFHGVGGMTELNTKTYFLKRLTDTTYELYTDGALTAPLNTSGFTTFVSGFLWAATGPALILGGGVKDVGHGHGYFLTYGNDAIVIDDQYGPNEINNVRFDFQHEATPQRSIRYVAPDDISGVPQTVNHHDHHFSFLNAAQDWSTSVVAAQRVSGTGLIDVDNFSLNIPKWGTAPSTGVFASATDSYFNLKQATIRVPNSASFDVSGLASFSGTVTDYTNNRTTYYGNSKFANADTTWEDATIKPMAGTSAKAPVQFTAGAKTTSPVAGAMEYDGTVHLLTHADDARGVVLVDQFAILDADRTLTSTTAQQALFASTQDQFTVVAGVTYFFEALIHLSGMSATSGNFTFSMIGAGTATLNSCKWFAHGLDGTPTTAAAAGASLSTGATGSGDITTPSTSTACVAFLSGVLRVNPAGGGTLIPSVALTTAAAATAHASSFVRIRPIGTHTVNKAGAWA